MKEWTAECWLVDKCAGIEHSDRGVDREWENPEKNVKDKKEEEEKNEKDRVWTLFDTQFHFSSLYVTTQQERTDTVYAHFIFNLANFAIWFQLIFILFQTSRF